MNSDWHRSVTFVTGDDLREPPERPSQANGKVRQRQRISLRHKRARRLMQFKRRK